MGTVEGALGGTVDAPPLRPRGFVRVDFGPMRYPDSRIDPYAAVDPRVGARWHASAGPFRSLLASTIVLASTSCCSRNP